MPAISVLFARRDSIYKSIPDCDVWDIDRDARNFKGDSPIVAHPPCRGWGNLRMLSKASAEEKALGPWAAEQVQACGGVLEHPIGSTLWKAANLPRPDSGPDSHGGFTICIDQFWFGHRARKRTWLYICGISQNEIPDAAIKFGRPSHVITNTHGLRAGMPGYRKEVTKKERDSTPPRLAAWLCDLARLCSPATLQTEH